MKEEKLKFWNPERITTTGKSLRITQIRFNIIYIMRTNGKDGRIWRESLTLAVNWLLSTVIQNHPFLQTNQNQMSVSSK
ncbi:Uncharacterised protein [Escherichia coli]|nr:hypothetical protein A8G17_19625 [Escherichia coli]QKB22992.1 hypothetical protein E3158_13590 [Escherichia coli O55:H7]RCP37668.1 hypothetical protein A6581_17905 [Escherichia coli]CTR89720.1 Uncharacterised protein [Escherichia coli]CTT44358.1 Uncharacterised protein [Escherichia coli]